LVVLDNDGILFYFNWKSKSRRRLHLVSRERKTLLENVINHVFSEPT
jgi:hypothetical protein